MIERLVHDVAWAGAHAVLDSSGHLSLGDEQKRHLFILAYNSIRASIESYCTQLEREQQRLCPSKN